MPYLDCQWYDLESERHPGEGQDGLGECRVNPPTPAAYPPARGVWPRVKRTDYCRLWRMEGTHDASARPSWE